MQNPDQRETATDPAAEGREVRGGTMNRRQRRGMAAAARAINNDIAKVDRQIAALEKAGTADGADK
jgi:hypothetical protein